MHLLSSIQPTNSFPAASSPPPSPPLSPCPPLSSQSLFDTRPLQSSANVAKSVNHHAFNDDPDATILFSRANRRSASFFRPLPPITASPTCTPAASLHSKRVSVSSLANELSTTCISDPLPLALEPTLPTWISIPPTPPRQVPRLTRCRSVPHFPTSLSSSHEPERGVYVDCHRCSSLPLMLPSSRQIFLGANVSSSVFAGCRVCSDADSKHGSPTSQFVPVSGTTLGSVFNNNAARRPIFHISQDRLSDNEEDVAVNGDLQRSATSASQSTSESGSSTGGSSQDNEDSSSGKDDIRRYHALMELLSTEVGYLMDLRALVNVYLRFIHVAALQPTSSRSSLSFSKSRPHSLSLLQMPDFAPSLSSSHDVNHLFGGNKEKLFPKSLFSIAEVEILTRNAEDILLLHELFVMELRSVVTPLGFRMASEDDAGMEELVHDSPPIDKVDAAIRAVATKFTTEASRFNAYETFCSGHPQAIELVRKVQQRHPAEWDAFQQLASSLIANSYQIDSKFEREGFDDSRNNLGAVFPFLNDVQHAQLSCPPDGTVRTLRSHARLSTGAVSLDAVPMGPRGKETSSHRLALMDYLIKPVQRICKYPLLLSQLTSRERVRSQEGSKWLMTGPEIIRSDVNVIVESALQAMKHVASAVDEARRKQDISIQSSLIISRILLAYPLQSQTSTARPFQSLTAAFLTSLGACLLAGSLDVMHYPAAGDMVKAKYLGAFLYMGGYLVLVKVCKGKVYEPRHWFSLADFELVDLEEEEAMLPCSFRLSSKTHHFELAAACRREKETWMFSLRESITVPPVWTDEPMSSLHMDGRGEAIPSALEEEPFETLHCLPTIQSIPELINDPGLEADPMAPAQCDTLRSRMPLRVDTVNRADSSSYIVPPSRRSSTASVKAIFSPLSSDADTIVIRRSSPSARSQVDQGLQDVISTPCLAARSHASTHEEELFQAPKVTRSTMSSSGLSMAGAMSVAAKNRLTKHQSVRVPRRRSLIDSHGVSSEFDGFSIESKRRIARTKSLISRRHSKLTVIRKIRELGGEENPSHPSWDVASVGSTQSSASLASPTKEAISIPIATLQSDQTEPGPNLQEPGPNEQRTGRTRCMIDSFRSFLHRFPSSPLPAGSQGSVRSVLLQERPSSTVTPGLLRRWAVGPFHRRVRSTSDVPRETSVGMQTVPMTWMRKDVVEPTVITEPNTSPVFPEADFGINPSYGNDGTIAPLIYHVSPHTKRRSFLAASRFARSSTSSTSG